jgi:hypothetical protein
LQVRLVFDCDYMILDNPETLHFFVGLEGEVYRVIEQILKSDNTNNIQVRCCQSPKHITSNFTKAEISSLVRFW